MSKSLKMTNPSLKYFKELKLVFFYLENDDCFNKESHHTIANEMFIPISSLITFVVALIYLSSQILCSI